MGENTKENKNLQQEGTGEGTDTNNLPEKAQSTAVAKPRRGRPPGAKNKDTLFKELMSGKFQDIAQQNIQKTFEVLFEKAHEGDMKAIKLIMDRVVPQSKAIDLDQAQKKGLSIHISVGSLEDKVIAGEIVDAEYEEMEE